MVLSLAALADSIRNSPLLALLKVFALSIVAMGAVVLLYDEHRLTIEGLLFGMAAIIGIFLSKALIQSCEQANITAIELNRNPAHGSHRSIIYTAILTSLVIVGFWALYCESTASAIKALTLINPLLLLLNVSLVACTLTKGLCSHSFFSIERKQKTNFGWTNAHIFLFAGLCALMNQTFPIPFVSSTVQIGCFSAPFCFLFFLTQTSCGRHLDEMEIEQSSEHRSSTTVIHLRDEVEVHNQSAELDTLISPNGIAPHMVTSDISTLQEENFTNRHWRLHSQRIVSKALTSAIIAVVLGVWIAFGFLNYHRLGRPLEIRSVPIIDSTYQSQTELDIVINMYDEEPASVMKMLLDLKKLPTIQYRSTRVFIYYKGESEPIFDLPHHLGAVHLFPRPNVGREGETYLYHILSQRNNLATHTLFLQSHIHNTWEMHRRIDQYFVPSTGMLSLGFSGHTCDCDNCFDRWGWHDDRFQSLYTQIYNKTCSTALLSYKGQFIASARRLRGIDPAIYQHLSDALVYTESWAHRETYLEGQPDVMSAPFFGFTLERMWSLLLQCSEMDIALKCPTLLSGKRTEGDVSDCQCLDPL
ncbi:hypothetical protein F5884DRAFT_810074 [Xylogone sp. PMI_703]|nr:hypothetical protein F5884DRAFT_810074 [Xylogone sp. PMI_703]